VFLQYVEAPARRRLDDLIAAARRRATVRAPVFHLRMEPGDATFEVRLDDQVLGVAHAHGTGVVWFAR
jgi:hypothetical protein